MAINTQSARIKNHTSTTTGSFTVPASEDFTDGSWDKWDLAKSEFGVNEADVAAFLRVAGSIEELALVSNSPEVIQVACSDETTVLSTGVKTTFRMPFAMTIEEVRASLTTAGTGAALITVDINKGDAPATILSTKITIDASETTSETAATPPVLSSTSLSDDEQIQIEIDTIDTDNVAAGLKVSIIGRRA